MFELPPRLAPTHAVMDIGTAILIIGVAALVAAFCLLVIGLVFSELMNAKIPPGIGHPGKLHFLHGCIVGIAVVVSVYMDFYISIALNSPKVDYTVNDTVYKCYILHACNLNAPVVY